MDELIRKSFLIKKELLERIMKDCESESRTFTGQLEYIIKMYYQIKDGKQP